MPVNLFQEKQTKEKGDNPNRNIHPWFDIECKENRIRLS